MAEPVSNHFTSYGAPPVAAVVPTPSRYGYIDDSAWIKNARTQLNSSVPKPNPARPRTIFRLSDNIRRGDHKAYEPLVVPIGPYHSSRTLRGISGMPGHKWQCVRYLLSRHRSRERASVLFDRCLIQLKALDSEVRSCYSDHLHHDQHKLALVMLLDGCFIIHLLLGQVEEEVEEVKEKVEVVVVVEEEREDHIVELEIGEEEEKIEEPLLGMLWLSNLIAYDLLKLENQIPFFVIQTLFDILKIPQDKPLDLPKLALGLFRDIHPNKSRDLTVLPTNQVHHLLHLFHSSLVPSQTQPLASGVYRKASPDWIPSASDMKRGGIKFKKNETDGSFLDVNFKDGKFEIPQLRVYDYTNSLFRNLIAFEQCYPDTRTYVTTYAAFMDCIVDGTEDVKLLDSKGILINRLSTDEAVVNLFDQLCNRVNYASDRSYLADVFVSVKKYRESKCHRWRAELMRNYFSNPWAGVAVVAVVLLFLLIIEQSVFAALSYFGPP